MRDVAGCRTVPLRITMRCTFNLVIYFARRVRLRAAGGRGTRGPSMARPPRELGLAWRRQQVAIALVALRFKLGTTDRTVRIDRSGEWATSPQPTR